MKETDKKRGRAATPAATIWTLQIKLVYGVYAQGPWEATIEIESSATLADLHYAIQNAVGFDDDHLYMFYVSRTHRSRERTVFEDEDGVPYETTLDELYPVPPGEKLFYWFDFGHDWKFSIERIRTEPQAPDKKEKYPRLIETRGESPQQYPDCD